MTAQASLLPPIPVQDFGDGLLKADFYCYEDLLTESQWELVNRMRKFFRTSVVPIVDDYWARAEFPHQLVPEIASLGLLTWADPDADEQPPGNLLTGIVSME